MPNQKNLSFTIKYIPILTDAQPKEFQLCVGEFVTVNEIRQKIEEQLRPKEDEDEWIPPFLTTVTNKSSIEINSDERFLKCHDLEKNGQEIVAYEREPMSIFNPQKGDDISDLLLCEIRMVQPRRSMMGLFSAIT